MTHEERVDAAVEFNQWLAMTSHKLANGIDCTDLGGNKIVTGNKASVGLMYCNDCGEQIPEARRQIITGARLCVYCQQTYEKESRMYK